MACWWVASKSSIFCFSFSSSAACFSSCTIQLTTVIAVTAMHKSGVVCRVFSVASPMTQWFYLGCNEPSVLWRCWLGGRKGIRPVKNFEWCSTGMVICLERDADLHTAQLMPLHSLSLASVKSRLVLPFWYRLTRVVPEKGPLNGCVCVCVQWAAQTVLGIDSKPTCSRDNSKSSTLGVFNVNALYKSMQSFTHSLRYFWTHPFLISSLWFCTVH